MMKRTLQNHRGFGWALLPAFVAGCSLVNSFDDVVTESPDTGDGDGDGSGGSAMGGDGSGGRMGMGGEGDGGSGTGGTQVIEPGLILAVENTGPLPEDGDILHFISPQNGKQLATDEADYRSAAYEPKRDVWFFVRDNMIIPGRFHRGDDELELLAETGPDALGVSADTPFMALNERLALRSGQQLRIFDTSDLANIEELEPADLSPILPLTGLWDMAAAPKTLGGNVNLLYRNCAMSTDATCPIEIASVAITPSTVVVGSPVTVVPDFDNTTLKQARGNLSFDAGAGQMVAVIPSSTPVAKAHLFSPDTLAAGNVFDLPQPGNQIPGFVVDPCQSVGYANSQLSEALVGFAMTSDPSVPLNESIGLPGRALVFEPHTRSIITLNDESSDFGLFAFSITGTPTEPDVRKRIVDWSPPEFKPGFIAAETSENPVCD